MLGIDRAKLRESDEAIWLFLDLVMLGLLLLNLALIIFDSLFATSAFRHTLDFISPAITQSYQPVHDNFLWVDLSFIAIFLSEFFLRWGVALKRKTYMRWYFFPFIHWYDLIGCIPLTGARIFRFLRIFSILYRLHKLRIINLRNSGFFRFLTFYYDVFMEELSDRIIVKALTDAQKDIAEGSPLIDNITREVLLPRRDMLCQWVSSIAVHLGHSIADDNVGEVVRQHIKDNVAAAVHGNTQVSALKLVPVMGHLLEQQLSDAVADIVINSVVNLLQQMTPEKVDEIVQHGLTAPTQSEQALDKEMLLVINESLDLVKAHISTQRWKEKL